MIGCRQFARKCNGKHESLRHCVHDHVRRLLSTDSVAFGTMAERPNAPVLKTGVGVSPPGVQIPLVPPSSLVGTLSARLSHEIPSSWRGARVAEWGALLRRCPGQPDRGFKSLPLRHFFLRTAALTLSAVAIAVVTPLKPDVAAAATCTQYHTAKPNDSWSRLAARFGLSQRQLLELNNARSSSAIYVGDRLCVSTQPIIKVPSETFTRREVVAIIREVWPDELEETALFVAKRESNYQPAVVGGTSNCCYGLFQMYWSVHRSWLSRMGITEPSQLLNPRTNAEAALALYQRNGDSWRPWWTSSWRP